MNATEGLFKRLLSERDVKKLMLSMTVGMEHYTALFGNQNLGNAEFIKMTQPEEMFMMTLWHSAEELEHKAVAFDVLKEVDDSYALRIGGMLLASAFFYPIAFGGMTYFIAQDPKRNLSNMFSKFLSFGKNFGLKPKGSEGWRILLDYFKPGFHPDDHDNYHLAEEFFEQYADFFEEISKR